MGDTAGRTRRRTVAALLAAAVAAAAVTVAVLRPNEDERFRTWLVAQPDIVSVDDQGDALASSRRPDVLAGRVFEPSLRAVAAHRLDPSVVDRLGGAMVRYAADHPAVAGTSVELRQGPDAVLLWTTPSLNATTRTMLASMRGLPSVVSVRAVMRSGTAPFSVTVAAGADVPATARTLAKALPEGSTGWPGSAAAAAVLDPVGHEVRVAAGSTVTDTDARAFAVAVRTDPAGPFVLMTSRVAVGNQRSLIRLPASPRLTATADALHASGYGLASLGESVEGPDGVIAMDTRAWSTAAVAGLTRVPGVLSARINVGDAENRRPVVADLRVGSRVSLAQVLGALPHQVGQVEVHTSPAAPDYARDDALAPDPEVDCPAAAGGPNLAYSGPPDRLDTAANYLAALRSGASGATCVHWAEVGAAGSRPTTQSLLVRLPLQESSWRPVLDVVRARRADLGSAHPTVILLFPVPGSRETAVFTLREGSPPTTGALDTDSQARSQEVEDMLAPLVRYWARG